ncbi:MAG: hypothetical protein DSY33_00155 [Archaeoglobus sp.]|nr:MAG: hypothetical protein DSY33_00155 [Archaeoglobus sp.]
MKYIEKAVIATSTLVGLGILVASIVSLYNDFSAGRGYEYLMTDVVFFTFGVLLTGGSLRLYKQILKYHTITDEVFDDLVFTRLRPVLEEIAYSTVELGELKSEIERLAAKVERVERAESGQGTPIGKISFYMKSIVVSLVYIGAYLFMLNYYVGYTPYLFPVLYIIWWAFITKEMGLFNRFEAWLIMGIPVLIVPAMSIVIQSTIGIASLMGIIFSTSLLYAYLYYLYAQELVESVKKSDRGSGGKPINSEKIDNEIYISKNKSNFLIRKTKSFVDDIVRWLKS